MYPSCNDNTERKHTPCKATSSDSGEKSTNDAVSALGSEISSVSEDKGMEKEALKIDLDELEIRVPTPPSCLGQPKVNQLRSKKDPGTII